MKHADIPTSDDILRLAKNRDAASVTIYLPTSLIAVENDAARMELRSLVEQAATQLRDAGTDKREITEIEEALADLIDDSIFWAYTSNSLALFVTPTSLQAFRIPSRLVAAVEVSDRFYIKPLMRATTFSHSAFVLALAQGSVRLVEISADQDAETVKVPGLPANVAELSGRLSDDVSQKVRMRQYARAIDTALRPVLAGRQVPLILAGAEPLVSIYRSVNTSPLLATDVIAGNPEERTDAQLAEHARPILDGLYAQQIKDAREVFESRVAEGRTAIALSDVARAATHGAVDTVFVNIDEAVSGLIDETTGAVQIDAKDDAINYSVVDEIVRRVLLGRGRVLAVRADEMPGNAAAAAILRYPT